MRNFYLRIAGKVSFALDLLALLHHCIFYVKSLVPAKQTF